MIRVGILGATGYSALELIKLLLQHPQVEISAVTSRQEERPLLSSVHPCLTGRVDLRLEDPAPAELARRVDCVFSCLPHGVITKQAGEYLAGGCKLVDFSADYRLKDPAAYLKWYGEAHHDPSRLAEAVYGLPELFRAEIAAAKLIANPGCYPTSAILALTPLLRRALVAQDDLIVDSKSGVSGAGRTPKLNTHFPECNESFSAYNVGKHRHTPEIEQVLSQASGRAAQVIFTPHLVPMDRGILTTAYGRLTRTETSEAELLACLKEAYAGEPFVQVVEHLPATKDVAHTNFVHLAVRKVRERAVVIACLDNLIKGAAGAAVQNFNLLFGFPETLALLPQRT